MDNYLWNFLRFSKKQKRCAEREWCCTQMSDSYPILMVICPKSFMITYVRHIIWLSKCPYHGAVMYQMVIQWYFDIYHGTGWLLKQWTSKSSGSAIVLFCSFMLHRCVCTQWLSSVTNTRAQAPFLLCVTLMTSSWIYPRHFLINWNRSRSNTPFLNPVWPLLSAVVYLDISSHCKYVTFLPERLA